MPPQHGKSELVSRNLPAYILGLDPRAKIILASYSSTLASSFNRDCQRIIDTREYTDIFPQTKLSGNQSGSWQRNSELFEVVKHGGFLKTVGVGGSLTGTPADYAIIDDPVKDSVEAGSPTYQIRNWEWFNDVLQTRLHNNSGILLTQTRWDENDLSGLLLKKQLELKMNEWTVLSLPALRENLDNPEDPRQIGEALWEKRHSRQRLIEVKNQSPRTFVCLYQQDPQPIETGGEFYHQFKIHRHCTDRTYNPDTALHISFDFNIIPYNTAVVMQYRKEGEQRYLSVVDEFCVKQPRNSTKDVCAEIRRKYAGHATGMFIYGDPAGRKEDTRQEKGHNDFTIILAELQQFKPQLRLLTKAPSIMMRGNFINQCLETAYKGINIEFNRKCTNTIGDFAYIKQDNEGGKLDEKGVDLGTGKSYEKRGHCSDAFDYAICYLFAGEYADYQRGGLPSRVTLGQNHSKYNF